MKKSITLVILALCLSLSTQSFAAITGTLSVCTGGGGVVFRDSSYAAGSWSSSNTAIVTIGPAYGPFGTQIYGVATGTATISYSSSSGLSTAVVTVDPIPAAIVGGSSPICAGTSTTLSNPSAGGTWSSSDISKATIDPTTGVVTGVWPGWTQIFYRLGACLIYQIVTVNPTTVDSIGGYSSLCVGSAVSLSSLVSSGTWVSSNPAIASISGGVVTGIAAGTTIITHTAVTSCGTVIGTKTMTVLTPSSTVLISGPTSIPVGGVLTLSANIPGGSWISSNSAVNVSHLYSHSEYIKTFFGNYVDTSIISYTLNGCGSIPVQATYAVTVTTPNCISGDVILNSTHYFGPLKVWLVKYNPATSMLTACDSQSIYINGSIAHYSFCGMTTDSFRVKAAIDAAPGTTPYVPTYHNSSPFWNSATVFYRTVGTSIYSKDITMGYGTATAGPGFVSGLVTSGANRGTADALPVPNLLVLAINNATGKILKSTYTDATGRYSFGSLPTGTPIKIYPELINYVTTPYPAITLTAATPAMTAAHFSQNTLSETITPIVSGVDPLNASVAAVGIFPNPAHGILSLTWTNVTSGFGNLILTDLTGRAVLETNININQSSGTTQFNLSNISAGLYLLSFKANGINYNTKVVVE